MKEKFYHQKAFYWTLLTSVLILSVSLLTYYEKVILGIGSMKVYGSLGIVFAVGLLLKWKFVREILALITLVGLAGLIFITISSKELTLTDSLLGVTLLIISYLLLFCKPVSNYLKS